MHSIRRIITQDNPAASGALPAAAHGTSVVFLHALSLCSRSHGEQLMHRLVQNDSSSLQACDRHVMTICKVLWCGRLEVCGKSLSESQAFFHYSCHVKQRSAGAGAVWDLSDLVPRAKANKANCQQLSSYTQDMLRIFELKGQAPSSLPPPPKCPLEWLRPQQGLASQGQDRLHILGSVVCRLNRLFPLLLPLFSACIHSNCCLKTKERH